MHFKSKASSLVNFFVVLIFCVFVRVIKNKDINLSLLRIPERVFVIGGGMSERKRRSSWWSKHGGIRTLNSCSFCVLRVFWMVYEIRSENV